MQSGQGDGLRGVRRARSGRRGRAGGPLRPRRGRGVHRHGRRHDPPGRARREPGRRRRAHRRPPARARAPTSTAGFSSATRTGGSSRVDPRTGALEPLADRVGGRPMVFCNNAADRRRRHVWFSDSSHALRHRALEVRPRPGHAHRPAAAADAGRRGRASCSRDSRSPTASPWPPTSRASRSPRPARGPWYGTG